MLKRSVRSLRAALALVTAGLLTWTTLTAQAGAPTLATLGVDRTLPVPTLCIVSGNPSACAAALGYWQNGTFFHQGDGSALTTTPTNGTTSRSNADWLGDFVNVKKLGAKGDGRLTSVVATIGAGSTTLTTQTASFQSGDVGKSIILGNAGTAPANGPVMAIAAGSPGNGYTAVPSCAVTDASGSGSGATCAALMSLQGATLASGGSGCAADGTYEFVAGIDAAPTAANPGTPAKLTGTVSGGVLTGSLTVTSPGLLPALGTLSGAPLYGGNCTTPPTANLSYGVAAEQVTASGTAYSPTQTTAALSGGSPTTAATTGAVTAGIPAQPLSTTIAAYTSPTQVTLAASATTALSSASVQLLVATDDKAAIQNAINAAIATNGPGGIWLPAGTYWLSGRLDPNTGGLTVRGDGPTASTIVWDANQSVTQMTAGWTPAFGNTGTSRATMRGHLHFEDLGFRGTLDFGRVNRGAAALELNFYKEVTFDRTRFYQAPNMAMSLEGVDLYRVVNSEFDTVMRDQARCRSCYNAIVRGNRFAHSDDDSVALHQAGYIQGAGNIREGLIVEDNTFEDTTCIHILGARSTVIRGNVLRRCKINAITVNSDAAEGVNQQRGITITDNVVADFMARPPFFAAGGAAISVAISPASAPANVTSFYPSAPLNKTTFFGKPWDYDLNSILSGTAYGPPARGAVVRGNQVMRTLPAVANYSAWGFGKVFSNVGYIDVPVPDSAQVPTSCYSTSINVYGLNVSQNVGQDCRRGLSFPDAALITTQTFASVTNNQFFNTWEYGIAGFGSGNVGTLDLLGNQVIVDPYGVSPGRSGGHGGWSFGYGFSKCLSLNYQGNISVRGNTFGDCYTIQDSANWNVSDNSIRGSYYSGFTGQMTNHSTANYGIGQYPNMAGNRYRVFNAVSDPTATSATSYGAQGSSRTSSWAAAPLTTGNGVIGDITWSTAPDACSCSGWLRKTTGPGWVEGVDYITLPAGFGTVATVAAAGTTQATGATVTASYNDVTSGTGGVVLSGVLNKPQRVFNSTSSAITVYPASGQAIGSGAANAGVTLAAGATGLFLPVSSTQVRQAP